MKPKVYLAGPINGCTDAECKDWRERAKQVLGEENCVDPMRRDYRGREDACFEEIVELDKTDILGCGAVLVNYNKGSDGTAMEILYAYHNGVPVFIVAPAHARISPWVRYHATCIFHSLEDALERLK